MDIVTIKEMMILDKKKQLKQLKSIRNFKVGVLSTSHNNKPNSRYMVFYNDDLTLYTKTSINSVKVDEIEDNPTLTFF